MRSGLACLGRGKWVWPGYHPLVSLAFLPALEQPAAREEASTLGPPPAQDPVNQRAKPTLHKSNHQVIPSLLPDFESRRF